jgi:hypothetical protein
MIRMGQADLEIAVADLDKVRMENVVAQALAHDDAHGAKRLFVQSTFDDFVVEHGVILFCWGV